jgi:hypothetical protein
MSTLPQNQLQQQNNHLPTRKKKRRQRRKKQRGPHVEVWREGEGRPEIFLYVRGIPTQQLSITGGYSWEAKLRGKRIAAGIVVIQRCVTRAEAEQMAADRGRAHLRKLCTDEIIRVRLAHRRSTDGIRARQGN